MLKISVDETKNSNFGFVLKIQYLKSKIKSERMKLNILILIMAFATAGLQASIYGTNTDSIPNRMESYKIIKKTNDQDIDLSIVNGEVSELKINGKTIAPEDYGQYRDLIDGSKPKNNRKPFGSEGFSEGQIFNFDLGDMEQGMLSIEDMMGEIDFEAMSRSMEQMQKQMFGNGGLDSLMKSFKMMDMPMFNQEIEVAPHSGDLSSNSPKPNNYSEVLGEALNRDGFLIADQDNKVELTGKHLKINGEKQPNNIYQKYKRVFEEQTGVVVDKKTNLQFSIKGKEPKRKFKMY